MKKTLALLLVSFIICSGASPFLVKAQAGTNYYVDSLNGADSNAGTSPTQPWQSLEKAINQNFQPGDTIHFKHGSSWTGELVINDSGVEGNPITFTTYGTGPKPTIRHPGDSENWTSAVTIEADWIILEGLLVRDAHWRGVNISPGSEDNIIRDIEATKVGIGIAVYGQNNLITQNNIYDLTMVKNTPGGDDDFGAVGVWLFGSHNEVSYNRMVNCKAESLDYGFDGGAVEFYGITDGNFVHHNWATGCDGAFEVGGGSAKNNVIAYNVFLNNGLIGGFHLQGQFASQVENFRFENNTVIETLDDKMEYVMLWWNGQPSETTFIARNNIFYVGNFWFFTQKAGFTHDHNLYHLTNASTKLTHQGDFLLDEGEILANPLFVDINQEDFHLQPDSPAIDAGLNLGYSLDFDDQLVPAGIAPEIGAYEYTPLLNLKTLLKNWGFSNPDFDLNKDGVINGLDFGTLRKLVQ